MKKQKAFFFDRDGVINHDAGYTSKIEGFVFFDGIFAVMRELSAKGFALFVVTNQSGIGRGYYSEEEFQTLTAWMLRRFEEEGVRITGVYHCPHSPESNCDCRKPAPGMFMNAFRDYDIDPAQSWMVGDKPGDMEAAAAAGIPNRVLIGGADCAHTVYQISKINELLELPV